MIPESVEAEQKKYDEELEDLRREFKIAGQVAAIFNDYTDVWILDKKIMAHLVKPSPVAKYLFENLKFE